MTRYRTELWTASNQHRSQTNYIVIHHAAARYKPGQAVSAIYNFHKNKWPAYNAAGYHIILQEEPDATISINLVNCPFVVGAGVAQRNHETFHICLASDFTNTIPDHRWIDATREALRFARNLFPDAALVGHRDIALRGYETSCPGNRWREWKLLLEQPPQSPELSTEPTLPAITVDTPLVGDVVTLTTQRIVDIAQRIASKTRSYSLADIVSIIQAYHSTSVAAKMNVFIPLAQMIHETGWLTSFWSQRPQRNPAGIGVTGEWQREKPANPNGWAYNTQRNRWERGISFPSWISASVQAHVGRLLAYALTDDEADQQQKYLITTALSYRPLPDRLRGKCKTLRDLEGTWAVPGNGYAQRIVDIAQSLMDAMR